jgi:hypothetical protein
MVACLFLGACDGGSKAPESQALDLPARLDAPHVSDQTVVAGQVLALWDDGGGCKLQVGKAKPELWLKPVAPCFFMKSPGTQAVQVYQHDKTTFIVAVLGTPAKGERCGQEVQGLRVKGGKVTLSTYIMQGSVHCAAQGLHNYQYGLFAK